MHRPLHSPRRVSALGVVIFVLCFGSSLAAAPKVGSKVPGFALRDPEGAWFKLSEMTYPGPARTRKPKHVVLLDFFSTDCKPCIKALPKLIKLHKKYKGKPVKVVLLALPEKADTNEKKLAAFLRKHPLPFLVLVDSYGKVARKYVMNKGLVRIPALFVVNKDMVLKEVVRKMDARTLLKLEKLVERLAK